jgi:murein tripeptide amidase MpaA
MAQIHFGASRRYLGRFASAYLLTCNLSLPSAAFALLPNGGTTRSPSFGQRTTNKESFQCFSTRVSISDAYDGGNIQVVEKQANDADENNNNKVLLNIKPDPYTELEKKHHSQYFSFRSTVSTTDDESSSSLPSDDDDSSTNDNVVEYVIDNAGDASYAEAWDESTVFYSTSISDPLSWKRKTDTRYQDGKLSWTHSHSGSSSSVYFCYFPPYSYARHLDLIEQCYQQSDIAAHVESLGQTLDGAELECVRVGTGSTIAWVIHRQHPGEHMAEYYAEGLLTRLLGLQKSNGDVVVDDDLVVSQLLQKYTFYIVPSMNPDGGTRGHLRTNACGANLNREWASSPDYEAPTMERSPEVHAVLEKMKQTGVDVFLDIHGDELIPYNFLAQPSVPNWGPRLQSLHGAFLAAYSRTTSAMQQNYAYEPSDYVDGDVLNIASDQVAFQFDCLSITLEMPFKDCLSNPDPELGWSPSRASALGASVLEPLLYIHPYLRDESDFWESLPDEDAYVRPTSNYKQ